MTSRISLVTLFLCVWAPAQEYRGTLTGRVTDPQGLAVPEAKVAVRQVDTGALYQAVTEQTGQYTIPLLPPATYEITVTAQGFKTHLQPSVRVSTGDRLGVDVILQVGATQESITVSEEASLLQTASANTGQVLSTTQIENMPMNGRTPLVLAQLAGGVVPPSGAGFSRPFDNQGPSEFSMSGAPSRSNEILIDGAPNNTKDNRVAYNPPADAVQEMRIDTFQSDAAFGNTVGGVVNMVMKTGTNTLHGTAYWFNQVAALNATPFFTNAARQPKPPMRFNQYGLTVGGPVVLPKLFDGRNKMFFYIAYEGIKDAFPRLAVITVPTEAQRRGDFSALLALGPQYQIYDPVGAVREGSRIRRVPFAGNIIPQNRLSPVALAAQKLFPVPNLAGRADGVQNYMSSITGEKNDYANYLMRGDWNISVRQKLALNYRYNFRDSMGPNELGCYPQELCGNAGGRTRVNYGATADHVLTLSAATVLNTRLNFTRYVQGRMNFSEGFDLTTLGMPAALNTQVVQNIFPRFEFANYFRLGDGGSNQNPQDIFQVFSTVNQVRGNHTLKFGTDLRLYRDNLNIYDWPVGRYSFGTEWTRGPLDNSPAAPVGQDYAAFLLGLPTGGQIDRNAGRAAQSGYMALFLQDDWRVTSGLTLNLGLRWEADLPTTERFNRVVNGFDFDAASPINAAARAAYAANPVAELGADRFALRGGLTFAGPERRIVFDSDKFHLSPRFGIVWRPGGSSSYVIRAGAGMFFDSLGSAPGIVQSGFFQSTPYVSTLDNYLTPANTLSNPFPNGPQEPPGASQGLATYMGQGISFFTQQPLNPYSIKWNWNVQRELPGDIVVELGYAGNRAVHLPVDQQMNYVPAEFLSRSPDRNQAVINNLTAAVPNPMAGLLPGTNFNGTTVQRAQLLRAYPQFGTSVLHQGRPDGSSYFHAMQTRVQKRLSSGLTFLANYQFSKLIEKTSRLNDFEGPEKRISDIDRPHRFVASASYALPWLQDRGTNFASRTLRVIAGGWVLNGIYTWQSGAPLVWGNIIYLGGDLNIQPRNLARAFETSRFLTDSREQLEWNVRTFPSRFADLRTDAINNADLSILKNLRLAERLTAQLRVESFNALNRAQFGNPNVSPVSTAFGTITGQANQPRRMQMALRLSW